MNVRPPDARAAVLLAALGLLSACGDSTGPDATFSLSLGQTGSGSVTSSPAGVSTTAATPAASAAFAEGTVVTLTATPDGGWQLDAWSGACSGTAAICELTMSADRSASVTFSRIPRTLGVTVTGSGGVASSPAGLSIPSGAPSGSATFPDGTVVTLTATPDPGWQVHAWGGACSGAADTCELTMGADQSASVAFVESTHTLEVSTSGSGAVESSPAGIAVASGETSGSAAFDHGAVVTLTATPDAGWQVESWAGACEGATDACEVTVDADATASVTFSQITYELEVVVTGSGAVESSPEGITLASGETTTTASFLEGTVVTLGATPDLGWGLGAWGDACEGAADTCEITMDGDKVASVTFSETIPELTNGETLGPLDGGAGAELFYRLIVPEGASSLRVALEGGSGDADLYLRFGATPTEGAFDCRPYAGDSNESCNFGRPTDGTWIVGVFGFTAFSDVSLTASYEIDDEGFTIRIVYDASTSGWTTEQQDAVEAAIRRWEDAIDGDVDGIWFTGGCGYAGDEYVDDLLVFVREANIDGASNTLAQAGFCEQRSSGPFQSGGRIDAGYDGPLPYAGVMTFDAADFEALFDSGLLGDVAAHEAGHILGIGSLWDNTAFDYIQGPPSAPYHIGAETVVEYVDAGGSGSQVPIEPHVLGHWDEVTFNAELMTPSIDAENPMSRITLAALADMGYGVDYALADPYTVPAPGAAALRVSPTPGTLLLNDVLVYPMPAPSGNKAGR